GSCSTHPSPLSVESNRCTPLGGRSNRVATSVSRMLLASVASSESTASAFSRRELTIFILMEYLSRWNCVKLQPQGLAVNNKMAIGALVASNRQGADGNSGGREQPRERGGRRQ